MSTFIDTRGRAALDSALRHGGIAAAQADKHPFTRRAALRALPALLERRADAETAALGDAVLELRVRASAGGPETRFRLAVSGGGVSVTRGVAQDAITWFSVSLADMIRLIAGDVTMWELLAQKHLDFGGEPFTAMRIPALLGL